MKKIYKFNRKGTNTLEIIVGAALAIFAAVIIIILFSNNMRQVDGVNDDCTNGGGVCVERSECSACSSVGDCKVGFKRCADVNGQEMVCCPKGDVI